jgi:hypothetical protein
MKEQTNGERFEEFMNSIESYPELEGTLNLCEDITKKKTGKMTEEEWVAANNAATNKLEELRKELEPYRNTLVLDYFDVVRLVDVVDGEDDYYWVYDDTKRGVHWSSCVGGWKPLKGVLKDEDYNELVRVWNLNNVEKAI